MIYKEKTFKKNDLKYSIYTKLSLHILYKKNSKEIENFSNYYIKFFCRKYIEVRTGQENSLMK